MDRMLQGNRVEDNSEQNEEIEFENINASVPEASSLTAFAQKEAQD